MFDDAMKKTLTEQANVAVEWIKKYATNKRVRLISHYDADGITAAAIMAHAVKRSGFDFHLSLMRNPFTDGLKKVKQEQNDLIIFTDMGSGQLPLIEQIDARSIIIDHHQLIKYETIENILQLNTYQFEINGNYDASGASLSYAVALALDKQNKDLAVYAITGATGDKQYIGNFTGYNQKLIDTAVEQNIVTEKTSVKLNGKSMKEALYYAVDPYYKGLSGRMEQIIDFLKKLNINPDIKPESLTDEQQKKIHSALLVLLLEHNCEANIIDTVIRPRYYSEQTWGELEQFADLLDCCGKGGHRDLGFALCMNDADAYDEARTYEQEYNQTILDELLKLEETGAEETKSIRYFYTTKSSIGGVIGGIAVNYLFDREKPLFSIVKKPEELHVSCRGNKYLVKHGLDLGLAMETIAKKLDGQGGGHQVAAGATIPQEKEKEFLQLLDSIITTQLSKKKE
jgi:single-stranded-DNA-specific exonuclease